MRKSVIGMEGGGSAGAGRGMEDGGWLNLHDVAKVEVSSEDDLFPIEHALAPGATTGWRASVPGPQVIRLLFDEPLPVRRIEVHVVERAAERSQEFAVYAGAGLEEMREVVRQQFSFSPRGSTEEIERYTVSLDGVRVLELRIDPDRVNETATSVNYASLMALRVG